jgi:hypothetical protein
MHFLRKPLLAELATRRPESKSGALKCLTKYVYAVNQDNALCILFHSVLQTQKYTRNIRKAIEKCQKKIRTCIRITHVALHLLCLCLLPPVNLTSQDLPAKKTTYACSMHPLIPWQTCSEIGLGERYLQTSGPTKLHELCEILRIVFLTTRTQELPENSLPRTGHLVPAYAMAVLPSKENFLSPLVEP